MTTLTLPFKRFVAQVSTGAPRIKSTYIALMEENLTALKACPWREADADGPVTLTPHDFTQASYFQDDGRIQHVGHDGDRFRWHGRVPLQGS